MRGTEHRRGDRRRLRPGVLALEGRRLLTASLPGVDGSSVVAWNATALEAIRVDKTAPPAAARDLAIVQIAVDHAIDGFSALPRVDRATEAVAAVNAAARTALDGLFPGQAPTFDALYQQDMAALPAGTARTQGVVRGTQAATEFLASRANDGSQVTVFYTPGSEPGQWRPTLPGFAPALLPNWPYVTPFVSPVVRQLLPPPPPSLASAAYAQAVAQVEKLGAANSTTRTADQTQIANFWSDGAGTSTPPGHWNEIAANLATSRHFDLASTAHVFATLDAALADAGIAAWNAKYTYNCWRPITAIREAGTDGNPATVADPSWTPLLATPAFPSYVSGHSAFSAAAATVLSAYFGPNTAFSATSDAMPGVVRHFSSFAQAAQEAGMSRIYGGIHFSFDNLAGLAIGRTIGRLAVARAFSGGGF